MFTGIITHRGTVTSITKQDSYLYTIHCPDIINIIKEGSSVAHDGACLTVLDKNVEEGTYALQLIPETVHKTKFSQVVVGDTLNIEMAMTLQQPLDGHIVQGHVDGTGTVDTIHVNGDDWKIRIIPESNLMKYIAYKGSIAINGVSLTVSSRDENWCEVSLIQHTLQHTNLGSLHTSSLVNIEVDVIARYIENMI